jgi:hypothetical protein
MTRFAAFGVFALVGAIVAATPVFHFATMDNVSFTVEHRERVISTNAQGSSSRYMVWGLLENGNTEVFENTDSLLALKFNSADFHGRMREGRVCDATVTGWRIPIFSMNRNIIDVECLEQ